MKNNNIYKIFTEFINSVDYKIYFMSAEEQWFYMLEKIKNYIHTNHRRPTQYNHNGETKRMGIWIQTQKQNYENKINIMQNNTIYKKWIEFINSNKYKKYFTSNEEEWYNKLKSTMNYIDSNNKRPSTTDKNITIKTLGRWINNQKQNYTHRQHIMQNNIIYQSWEDFINSNKYKKFFY